MANSRDPASNQTRVASRGHESRSIAFANPLPAPPAQAQSSQLLNISTRLNVLTGDNVLIGGFIITGNEPKRVIIRAIGPSLGGAGLQAPLADPILELNEPGGAVITNDNWRDTQEAEIIATTIPPSNDLESAIVANLPPGAYTATVRGKNGGTGVGLIEAYDLASAAHSRLANISTRGLIQTGDSVMIGGFLLGGTTSVVARAIGPSLAGAGIADPIPDPTLELHDGNGSTIAYNDDWINSEQSAEIQSNLLAPSNDLESAILTTLGPGPYTAIVRGYSGAIGVGLVEVYNISAVVLESVTQTISAAQGGTITLPTGNSVSMPAGMFGSDQDVTLSLLTLSPTIMNEYLDTTAVFKADQPANQLVVIDTGFAVPQAEMFVSIKIPDDFHIPSGSTPQIFTENFWDDGSETQDVFEPLTSTFNAATNELTATVPRSAFTSLRNEPGTYQSLIVIGSGPIPSGAALRSRSPTGSCPLQLFAPLAGVEPDQLMISSPYGLRDHPIDGTPKQHTGLDIVNPVSDVVAAANGQIVRIGYNEKTSPRGNKIGYGQYVVVRHPDGSETLYGHLEAGSITLANQLQIPYPTTPGAPLDLSNPIPVTGGTSTLGTKDTTGGATGPHLHFEYSTGYIFGPGRTDPQPCVTQPAPVTNPWNGHWVGTDHDTFSDGVCSYTGDANVDFTFSSSGEVLSGNGSAIGLPCFYDGDCSINDFPNVIGTISGSVTGTSGTVHFSGTAQSGVCQGQGAGLGFTGTVSGNTINGTTSRGGVVTLTRQ